MHPGRPCPHVYRCWQWLWCRLPGPIGDASWSVVWRRDAAGEGLFQAGQDACEAGIRFRQQLILLLRAALGTPFADAPVHVWHTPCRCCCPCWVRGRGREQGPEVQEGREGGQGGRRKGLAERRKGQRERREGQREAGGQRKGKPKGGLGRGVHGRGHPRCRGLWRSRMRVCHKGWLCQGDIRIKGAAAWMGAEKPKGVVVPRRWSRHPGPGGATLLGWGPALPIQSTWSYSDAGMEVCLCISAVGHCLQ